MARKHLTHEFLSKSFSNQFDFVKEAIARAENKVRAGVDFSGPVKNITTVVLDEMEKELGSELKQNRP